jgi:hypothetical protein
MAWRKPMLACPERIESEEAVFGLEEVDFCLTGLIGITPTGPVTTLGQAKVQIKKIKKITTKIEKTAYPLYEETSASVDQTHLVKTANLSP